MRLASSCTVMTSGIDHLARGAGLFLAAALALFAFAFAGPADRGQGAHAFDRALVVCRRRPGWSGGLRGACGSPLTRRDGLVRAPALPRAAVLFVEVGTAIEIQAAGARRLAGGALDLGRRPAPRDRPAPGRAGRRDAARRAARGRRARGQRRIAHGLAGARPGDRLAGGARVGHARLARPGGGGSRRRGARGRRGSVVSGDALAIGDGRRALGPVGGGARRGRRGAAGASRSRSGAGRRSGRDAGAALGGALGGRASMGGAFGRRALGAGVRAARGRSATGACDRRRGDAFDGRGAAFGGGGLRRRDGLGGWRGAASDRRLGGGFLAAARLVLGGAAARCAARSASRRSCSARAASSDALAGACALPRTGSGWRRRPAPAARRGRGAAWRRRARRASRRPTAPPDAAAGRAGRVDAPALGLDHHGLGPAMAEALLHRAGADGALARLQLRGARPPGFRPLSLSFASLMRSLYSLACAREDRRLDSVHSIDEPDGDGRMAARPFLGLLAPTLRKERTETRKSLDIGCPALGASSRKEDDVYHISQAQGQTQFVRTERAEQPGRVGAALARRRAACAGRPRPRRSPRSSRPPCRRGPRPAPSRSPR